MSRPIIVVFSKLFWPEGGGAELATHIVVRDALSKNFEVCRFIHWSVLGSRYKPFGVAEGVLEHPDP